jgi:hypothetical protein
MDSLDEHDPVNAARLTPLAGFFAFSERLSSRRKPEAPLCPSRRADAGGLATF